MFKRIKRKKMSLSNEVFISVSTFWCRGVVVITTAQLDSTKSELRLCAVQALLTACQRFAMVRISDNDAGWK